MRPFEARLLRYIADYVFDHRCPPKWREMCDATGGSSGAVASALASLREAGYVDDLPRRSRRTMPTKRGLRALYG